MTKISLFILPGLLLLTATFGKDYFVDPAGMDTYSGSFNKPFRTISKAAEVMRAGDTCFIRPGTYREAVVLECSGSEQEPVRFIGAIDDQGASHVTIDGTSPILGNWMRTEVNGKPVYSISHNLPTVQVFYRGNLMREARWPDQPFSRIWDRSTWAKGGEGSYKGKMYSDDIAATNVDWTGALAVLNVGHQFKTWVREVRDHSAGSDTFNYVLEERMGNDKEDGPTWWDDRFYLIGKIEALTSPEEWFYDDTNKRLLFYPPDGRMPEADEVTCKVREYGFSGSGLEHIQIRGIQFHGCTFSFTDINHLTVENCHILYPNYSRLLYDTQSPDRKKTEDQTRITGNDNILRKLWIAYGNTAGIEVRGSRNVVENSVINDICWDGNIHHPAILVTSKGDPSCESRVSHCTIYNTGNVGIRYANRNNIIEYNHVYNTGLACKDIAAIHTGSPEARGSVVRHNWVHDSMGKGIRGDDQTRGLTFHHNVVWNCDEGMILKGDDNKCYNNTILGENGHGCLIIPTRPEPQKWWAKHEFLQVQNMNSVFCNNLAEVIVYRHDPLPDGHMVSHNAELSGKMVLKDLIKAYQDKMFFSVKVPIAVDSGKYIDGVDMEFAGNAPDIGAYEVGGSFWTAGADWNPPDPAFELVINAEVARSWEIQSPSVRSIPLPKRLGESSLQSVSKKKLQDLYDDCWTREELGERRLSIQQRKNFDKGTDSFEKFDREVARLHRQAVERLSDRAGEVLEGTELELFREIVK